MVAPPLAAGGSLRRARPLQTPSTRYRESETVKAYSILMDFYFRQTAAAEERLDPSLDTDRVVVRRSESTVFSSRHRDQFVGNAGGSERIAQRYRILIGDHLVRVPVDDEHGRSPSPDPRQRREPLCKRLRCISTHPFLKSRRGV